VTTSPPFGAVFDWDGVIINSEECHRVGWERLAAEVSRELPAGYFERSFGRRNVEIIPEMLGWSQDTAEIARLALRKEEHYRDVVRECGAHAPPGVLPWLQALFENGIPCGIGSSTARANIDLSLELIGCAKFFRAIVSAEDVTRGKPAPDIFLTVADRIGVPPERCVVFEDALVGLEAARRAGMKCIAVATTNPRELLAPHADRVVQRLDELDVDEMGGWVAAALGGRSQPSVPHATTQQIS
jgi:HAD superfamily hydrolase (TIGR01509 family)